jgi:hypothetical protein
MTVCFSTVVPRAGRPGLRGVCIGLFGIREPSVFTMNKIMAYTHDLCYDFIMLWYDCIMILIMVIF